MRNAKHTIIALTSVALICTIGAKQAHDFKTSNRLAALLANSEDTELVLAPEDVKVSDEDATHLLNESYTQEELDNIEAKKSEIQESYVLLTYGDLSVYNEPSEEGTIVDTLSKCDSVHILSSTEEWYYISYGDGKTGYVLKNNVTDSKAEADYAAMHYDNYKRAKIKTNGDNVNIRSSASKNSSVIDQLKNGDDVVLLYDENGYTKVLFGSDLVPGFVVSTAIELTGEWAAKTDVAAVQQAAAERKAKEAKEAAEKAAKEKAEKAEKAAKEKAAASKKSSSSNGSYETPASSSKGQTIVNTARKCLGIRYVYGGTSTKGFDCSGLAQYCCRAAGVSISRTSGSQFSCGKAVNKSDLQPGDLLFFAKGGRVHHVGIYIGNGQMIHAPHTGDVVRVASINSGYYSREYVGARRVY